jgi:hypothetical protein
MTIVPTAATPGTATPVRRSRSGWRALLVILGALLIVVGATLLAIGGVALWADQQRGDDGYFTAGPERLTTNTFALTAPSVDVNGSGPDAFYTEDLLGDVRIRAESRDAGTALFIGIGSAADVANYLAGVGHTELSDVEIDPFEVTYAEQSGGRPAASPAAQNFWVASDTGTGLRTLDWDVASGDWAVVIMNADGSSGIDADLGVAATLSAIRDIAVGALIGAALMLTIGIAVIVSTLSRRGRPRHDQDGVAR